MNPPTSPRASTPSTAASPSGSRSTAQPTTENCAAPPRCVGDRSARAHQVTSPCVHLVVVHLPSCCHDLALSALDPVGATGGPRPRRGSHGPDGDGAPAMRQVAGQGDPGEHRRQRAHARPREVGYRRVLRARTRGCRDAPDRPAQQRPEDRPACRGGGIRPARGTISLGVPALSGPQQPTPVPDPSARARRTTPSSPTPLPASRTHRDRRCRGHAEPSGCLGAAGGGWTRR